MKRLFRITDIGADLFHHKFPSPTIPTSIRYLSTQSSSSNNAIQDLYGQFADKWTYADVRAKEELGVKVCLFRDELMKNVKDESCFEKLLEVEGWDLFKMYSDGAAFVQLLGLLDSSPHLAIKVFNWRRKKEQTRPLSPEEYSKGIKVAGRIKDVDLAVEIFMEATNKRTRSTSTYNALMGAYMCNGLSERCQSVFRDLKQDINCHPTSVTYNMLISIFGHSVLVDQMEAVFQEMKDHKVAPNLTTYNNMIAGYLTAWMWDSMENFYRLMETGPIRPNLNTHLLMLRGYAHSGNLEKMEETYNIVGLQAREKDLTLVRAMICAYCKYPHKNRITRIKELLQLIPEDGYRPWLNVLLIRVYAEENLLDQMDKSIDEAFEHNTSVNTVRIMRTITSAYIRNNAVDKLVEFITHAGDSGWRMCRSLYHDVMWMFAMNKRIVEMEQVLVEMERFNYGCSKKTLSILYKGYSEHEERYRHKVFRVLGLMCKQGYGSFVAARYLNTFECRI